MTKLLIALAALMAAFPQIAAAADAAGHAAMVVVKDEAAVKWGPAPPSLPKGVELAVIMGDPSKPGPFALRVRMPPHTVIAPHTHATDETLTVLEGSFEHDMGATREPSRGARVDLGGFVYLPAQMPHSLWNGEETTVLQVNGSGPFGLQYVDPKDDPSGR